MAIKEPKSTISVDKVSKRLPVRTSQIKWENRIPIKLKVSKSTLSSPANVK